MNKQTLTEINKIKDYFQSEIKEQETMVKKSSKYITGLDYTDKILIVISSVFSGASIFSHLKIKKTHRFNKFLFYLPIFFINYSSNKKVTI